MIRPLVMTSILVIAPASPAGSPPDIPNLTQPLSGVLVGGQPSLADLEALRAQGYTTVINLRRAGEFDGFDEAEVVRGLDMEYVHIPLRNVEAITPDDARKLHQAISGAGGPVLLHCTIGWRAAGLLAIERYLEHGASRDEAAGIAAAAHMKHAADDVIEWLGEND